MSFSCRNYNYNNGKCEKLKCDCLPGRRGCVLAGRVVVSEELEKKLQKLTQNQYKVDPSGELSRLISIADPNMPQWLDASLLEDIAEIKKDIGKTVKKEMQKKDAPVFIDLSTE